MKKVLICLILVVLLVGVVNADTLIIFPSGNEDGMLQRTGVTETPYATIRNATTATSVVTSGDYTGCDLTETSSFDTFSTLKRSYYEFNTSTLPDTATINWANISLRNGGTTDSFSESVSVTFTQFFPETNGTAVIGDYDNFGNTTLTSSQELSTMPVGYINFSLNAAGLNIISKTGYSNFYLRDSFDQPFTPPGRSKSKSSSFLIYASEYTGTNYDPFIIIDYTPGIASPPVSSFTANQTSGINTLPVKFTDTSTNSPTGWNWSYTNVTPGNNTPIWWTTTQHPEITFGVGNFSIALNASNSAGSNISTQITFINVSYSAAVAPVASFTVNRNPARIPQSVTVTDTSTNTPTSWAWSWGDGTANSTTQNPTHEYTKRGQFNIILTATNAGGSGTNSANYVRVVGYENYY